MDKPKLHVVSFSGGKDSTAMLLRMIEEGMPVDIILYCDTGVEFPEMEEHIKQVEEYINRPITKIKANHDFMWYAKEKEIVVRSEKPKRGVSDGSVQYGYGWPSARVRWCTARLKQEVISLYLKSLSKDYNLIQYVGIAADEPKRKKNLNYPLIEWGMSEKDCLKYCYDRGFTWGGLYEIWYRVSCWCCPLQSLNDLRLLKTHRPNLWDKLKKMDSEMSMSQRPLFRFTHSLQDLERRFEVEEKYIALGKSIRSREFYQELKDRNIRY